MSPRRQRWEEGINLQWDGGGGGGGGGSGLKLPGGARFAVGAAISGSRLLVMCVLQCVCVAVWVAGCVAVCVAASVLQCVLQYVL